MRAQRARLRKQALAWLRADLEAWGRRLGKEAEKACPAAAITLYEARGWQVIVPYLDFGSGRPFLIMGRDLRPE